MMGKEWFIAWLRMISKDILTLSNDIENNDDGGIKLILMGMDLSYLIEYMDGGIELMEDDI